MHYSLFDKWQLLLENPPLLLVIIFLITLAIINCAYLCWNLRKRIKVDFRPVKEKKKIL